MCDLLGITPDSLAGTMQRSATSELAPSSVVMLPKSHKEMRVRAGAPLELRLPLDGEPPPTVNWLLDGKPVELSKVHVSFAFLNE